MMNLMRTTILQLLIIVPPISNTCTCFRIRHEFKNHKNVWIFHLTHETYLSFIFLHLPSLLFTPKQTSATTYPLFVLCFTPLIKKQTHYALQVPLEWQIGVKGQLHGTWLIHCGFPLLGLVAKYNPIQLHSQSLGGGEGFLCLPTK